MDGDDSATATASEAGNISSGPSSSAVIWRRWRISGAY